MKKILGLMSGTSLDGLDIAYCHISDDDVILKAFGSYDMPSMLKEKILQASHPDTSNVRLITSLNMELGQWFSDCITLFKKEHAIDQIDAISSHGQTIYHLPRPEEGEFPSTLQIGDPSIMAYTHHCPVVFNYRMMDMAAGGDGAPLVPYTEYRLYGKEGKNILLQNIGGIGNVTILDASMRLEDVKAFDTGPGNMMINAATMHYFNQSYDKDAFYARQGQLIPELFTKLCEHPYLQKNPPKSTGREEFGEDYVDNILKAYPQQGNDVLYTLTYFTAHTIADAYKQFIFPNYDVDKIILAGGGAYNPLLVELIKDFLEGYEVYVQEDLGFSSDAKEAVAFALLAYETLMGRANNTPSATGAKEAVILGQICPNPHFKEV